MALTKMSFTGDEPYNFYVKMRDLIDWGVNVKSYAVISSKCYTKKDIPKSKRKVIIQFNYKPGDVILNEKHFVDLTKFITPPYTIKPQMKLDYEEYVIQFESDKLLKDKKIGI